MAWTIEFEEKAKRDLARLDKSIQREIKRFLDTRVILADDPKAFGHALIGDMVGLWRYRVRDYRIICRIESDKLIVLVIAIGHRSTVYER